MWVVTRSYPITSSQSSFCTTTTTSNIGSSFPFLSYTLFHLHTDVPLRRSMKKLQIDYNFLDISYPWVASMLLGRIANQTFSYSCVATFFYLSRIFSICSLWANMTIEHLKKKRITVKMWKKIRIKETNIQVFTWQKEIEMKYKRKNTKSWNGIK